jgi:hypothetical protein
MLLVRGPLRCTEEPRDTKPWTSPTDNPSSAPRRGATTDDLCRSGSPDLRNAEWDYSMPGKKCSELRSESRESVLCIFAFCHERNSRVWNLNTILYWYPPLSMFNDRFKFRIALVFPTHGHRSTHIANFQTNSRIFDFSLSRYCSSCRHHQRRVTERFENLH